MSKFDLASFVKLFDDDRSKIVGMARTAEAAERHEDMCHFMKHLIQTYKDLSVEERNLLSVAYKNVIGTRRASWRTLKAEQDSSARSSDEDGNSRMIDDYKALLEKELREVCEEVIDLIMDLIEYEKQSSDKKVEALVFYLKMAGDYYRYLAESCASGDRNYPEQAAKFYKEAYDAATKDDALVPTHPIRLGLALNYSVCHYEIMNQKAAACALAKKAFDDAISKLDQLEESDYKDSTLIMQLLRDNLTLWSSSENDDDAVEVHDISDEEN